MDRKELIEVLTAMRQEILDIIIKKDIHKDREAKKALKTIKNMFDRVEKQAEDVIPKEALKRYYKGIDEATKGMKDAGMDDLKHGLDASISSSGQVAAAFDTQVHMDAIAHITDDTMLDLQAAIRTARGSASNTIADTLDEVKKDLQRGTIRGNSRKVITQRVAKSFADKGMRSFKTVDNRWLDLDFYSATVTRTNMKRANIKGAANRYKENGVKLFKVTGNTPTCGECAAYRDLVFSMDPEDDEFPYLDPETFPVHPNCECSIIPFVREYKGQDELDREKAKAADFDPDKDTRSKADKAAYDKQQALHRQNNYEKKRYADIKGVLGSDAPKTLGAFKRMKRKKTDNYLTLLNDYQDALKSIKG